MYERFTDRARKVMALSNQEAQRMCHEYIGTEHLLLGLVREGGGVGATILKNLDVDLEKVRSEIETLVRNGPDMVSLGKLPQTPRAKKVIDHAIEEARNLNHNYVGTEHLLLGLMKEQDGVAAHVLINLGLHLHEVRAEVLLILGSNDVEEIGKDVHPRQQMSREQLAELILFIGEQKDKAIRDCDYNRAADLRATAESLTAKVISDFPAEEKPQQVKTWEVEPSAVSWDILPEDCTKKSDYDYDRDENDIPDGPTNDEMYAKYMFDLIQKSIVEVESSLRNLLEVVAMDANVTVLLHLTDMIQEIKSLRDHHAKQSHLS